MCNGSSERVYWALVLFASGFLFGWSYAASERPIGVIGLIGYLGTLAIVGVLTIYAPSLRFRRK